MNQWIPEINDRVMLPDNDSIKGTICGTPAYVAGQALWPVKLDVPFWNEGKQSVFVTVLLVNPLGMVMNGVRIPKAA